MKKFWPKFSRIVEHDKRQETTYEGTQGFLTSIVQAVWSFLWDLRSSEQVFTKKGYISGDKRFWPLFSRFIDCDKCQRTNCKSPKGVLAITVEVIRSFLWRLEGCWKHSFLKKGTISNENFLWPTFSRIFEHDKRQGTTYEDTQDSSASIVWAIWSFPWDLRSSEQIFTKKGYISGDKRFWPLFFSYYWVWKMSKDKL